MLNPLALVLALMQAEAAPSEAPVGPPPGQELPATPAPPAPPAPTVPPAPAVPPVRGDAEQAPPEPAPGSAAGAPAFPVPAAPAPRFTAGLVGRLGIRVGPGSSDLGPRVGYSVGVTGEYAYLRSGPLDLAVGLDAFYDQYATGDGPTYHVMSHTSFVALQKGGVTFGRVRVWVGGGGGLVIGYFHSDEQGLNPGDQTTTRAVVRAGAGVDVVIRPDLAVTVRGDYTWMASRPTFTTVTGAQHQVFSDLLDVGGGILYRF